MALTPWNALTRIPPNFFLFFLNKNSMHYALMHSTVSLTPRNTHTMGLTHYERHALHLTTTTYSRASADVRRLSSCFFFKIDAGTYKYLAENHVHYTKRNKG
jgi:RNA:NAD 2'-phosphotransferase (TPT1/KptA family)